MRQTDGRRENDTETNLAARLALIHKRVSLTTLLIFAALLTALLAKQYFDKRSVALRAAGDDLEERALSVDYFLSNAAEDVIESKIWAENYLTMSGMPVSGTELTEPIRIDAEYALRLDAPSDGASHGNILSEGDIDLRDASLVRQINMAFRLFEVQRINHYAPPDFTWSEFYSTNGFGSIYPWIENEKGATILARPVSRKMLASFASEPGGKGARAAFESFEWSEAYADSSGKGLMVTCASPVYDSGELAGMVSAEMSLSFLSHFVDKPGSPREIALIVNSAGQVLAATGMRPEKLKRASALREIVPGAPENLLSAKGGGGVGRYKADSDNIISIRLKNADWTMMKIVPDADIMSAFLPEALFGAVLIGLMFGFLTAANRVVNRHFVNPAVGFVGFIETEARTGSAPKPSVPPAWEEWFVKISDLLALKSVAANLPGAIFQMKTAPGGGIRMSLASSGAGALLGVSLDKLSNSDELNFDFLSPGDARSFAGLIKESESRMEPFAFEATAGSGEENGKWVRFILSPRRSDDPEGGTIWDGLMLDISDRKALEDELRRHRDDLEKTVEERTRELKSVNEELRNEIAERIRSENELKASEERLRAMSLQAMRAQDDERARLSRELHDEIGQQIAAALFQLPAIRNKPDIGPEDISKIEAMIRDIGGDLQRICKGLQPMTLTQFGLVPALKMMLWDFMKSYAIKIDAAIENLECRVDNERASAIYRICQEAVSNSARHSKASRVSVSLRREGGKITLEVSDDGIGFDPETERESSKLGVIGMKQRAEQMGGELRIDAAPGRGVRVSLTLDMDSAERGAT